MIVTRPRCPACGTRLNEKSVDRDVDLGDGQDVIEQDIGGRGRIATIASYDFDDYDAQTFLNKILDAKEYLEEILCIEESE